MSSVSYNGGSSGSNNPYVGQVTTNGAVTDDIITIPLGTTPGTYIISVDAVAFNASTPAGGAYQVVGGFITDGSTATSLGSPDDITHTQTALDDSDVDIVASGNDAIVQVTGVTGLSINWSASARILKVI